MTDIRTPVVKARDLKTQTPGVPEDTMPEMRDHIPLPDAAYSMSQEDTAAAIAQLQAQISALTQIATKGAAAANQANPNRELPTLEEALDQAENSLSRGMVPPAILTKSGWFVHPLAHSSTEQIDKHLNDKALRKQAFEARSEQAKKV